MGDEVLMKKLMIIPAFAISLFANTTSGIEPQFALVSIRSTFLRVVVERIKHQRS